MQRRVAFALACAATLATLGCGDQPDPATAVLRLSAAKTPPVTCSFSSMNPLVAHYFNGAPDKQVVNGLLNAMQTAFAAHDTTTTRDRGYDAMSHIASQVKAGNSDFQDASSLTNAVLACMLFSSVELPQTFPEDFTTATNPALDGGYDVRGEPPVDPDTDPGQRVYSRPTSFNSQGVPTNTGFSGLAPALNGSGMPLGWSQIIHTTRAPARVLLYGTPGSNSLSYDWRAVPRTVSYVAPAGGAGGLVGLCVVGDTKLVHETGTTFTGFNPFVDAYFMDPTICQAFALERSPWNPLRILGKLFSPAPLWGNPGGVGGLIGGHSEFDGDQLQMTGTFAQQPPANVTVCSPVTGQPNGGCPSSALFQVAVATNGTGTRADGTTDTGPVGPAAVHLTSVNNNGTFGSLCKLVPPANTTFVCEPVGDTTGTAITQFSGGSPGFSPATFTNLFFNKTGAERLVANGAIPQRAITAQVTSNKMNVKP